MLLINNLIYKLKSMVRHFKSAVFSLGQKFNIEIMMSLYLVTTTYKWVIKFVFPLAITSLGFDICVHAITINFY